MHISRRTHSSVIPWRAARSRISSRALLREREPAVTADNFPRALFGVAHSLGRRGEPPATIADVPVRLLADVPVRPRAEEAI